MVIVVTVNSEEDVEHEKAGVKVLIGQLGGLCIRVQEQKGRLIGLISAKSKDEKKEKARQELDDLKGKEKAKDKDEAKTRVQSLQKKVPSQLAHNMFETNP